MITDRDPYRCIVSLAGLAHAIAELFCEVNPLTDDRHRRNISTDQVPSKLASIADFTTDEPSRAMHVPYPELMRAPVDVVHKALDASAADDELSAKVITYLERQQAGERAAPRQSSIRWATTRRACGATRSSGRTANGSASNPSGPA